MSDLNSTVCKLLRDTGCVELPANYFNDEDITDLEMYFNECFIDSGFIHEVVALPDCYFLYLDTKVGADRFMKILQIKIASMEGNLETYKRALYNVTKCIDYFK